MSTFKHISIEILHECETVLSKALIGLYVKGAYALGLSLKSGMADLWSELIPESAARSRSYSRV